MDGPEEQNKPKDRVNFRVQDYATSVHLQATFTAARQSKVSDVKHMMALVLNKEVYRMRLFHKGCPMSDGTSLMDYNVRNGSIISLHYLRKGGRPGIYFLGGGPPGEYVIEVNDIHERLQGKQIEIYPESEMTDLEQDMSTFWRVEYEEEDSAKGRNLLKHLKSSSKCSALFWEPATYYDIDAIQSGRDMETGQEGIPDESTPPLHKDGTIVLALEELVPYLDDTLTHLCLPPKMAMQCLGYWLPTVP